MLAIMVIIVWDVSGRYFFNAPLTGTYEIVRNSIIGLTFFMLPWAMVNERHVRSTVIVDNLPDRAAKVLTIVAYMIGLFVFLAIVTSSWGPFVKSIVRMEYEGEGALRIVTFPVRGIIIVGSALSVWHTAMILLKLLCPNLEGKIESLKVV
jgi:TRAP-type C4-dicarboxylate transport system permease small subunit